MAELSNVTWGGGWVERGVKRGGNEEEKYISTEEKKIKKEVGNAGSLMVRGERKRGEKSEI